jgi:hypothetical protein
MGHLACVFRLSGLTNGRPTCSFLPKRMNYVLCSHGQEETLQHLFFECEFLQSCWSALHIVWNLSLSLMDMIKQQHSQFPYSCYMEVIILGTWAIWIHRNGIIFNGEQISLPRWKKDFKEMISLCKHRANPSLELALNAGLRTL